MGGDGNNDAPALSSANVGIAIGTAVAVADIAPLRGDIAKLPTALRLARVTLRTIHCGYAISTNEREAHMIKRSFGVRLPGRDVQAA